MKLIKISSDKVQIKTNSEELKILKINDLVLIADNQASIVCIVTVITRNDTMNIFDFDGESLGETEETNTLDCSILGSLVNGRFKKAIDQYPTINIEATPITSEMFTKMIQPSEEQGFFLGIYAAYNCPAFVDGNKFFQRHACIVGNTGSGKSETVAKILGETAKLPGANIIVFDIHGEYSKLSYAKNLKVGKELAFPVWLFGFSYMVSNILKVKEETSTTVMSALKKCYHRICPDGNANKPVYFNYQSLLEEMQRLDNEILTTGQYKNGETKTAKGDFNGKLSSVINNMEAKMNDKRYGFLFARTGQNYLFELVDQILGSDKPVKNIDLSEIPHDIAIPIIGVITNLIYDIKRNSKEVHPITLVCDEAHVYIPNNFQLSASERRMVEIFEDIAKEGRKFGVALFPASQRPSELNKTIMAQCANFIVSKLNNENDKSMIKGMLPDGNESMINGTTMFQPGDILMIGDAMPIPLKVHVDLATERPQSRTINFWDKWQDANLSDYRSVVERYIKQ